MTSPGPGSRIHSGAVTPIHPRAGGTPNETQTSWADDGKQQSHRLPLCPVNASPFSRSNSAATSPSVPRSPGRAENPPSPGSSWKKGKLLGGGAFGHVYVGFKSESGEMCAMKEVTLFSDDAKSKESAKQLNQEIALLSRLRHPNIVQYYGSESVDDKLYIYLEYVSGGSIYKLLQDYGQFGELAIRSYTKQILLGLAYLHAKNTVHRDIKGANILVDPNGRVKLADFGMAKHITGQSCPLSFKGSPYWMAPELIQNPSGANLAVDIWSLGCTVLEMATTKPPWSQYEWMAAMFRIGCTEELPAIPDSLLDDGKDFTRQCLQRNPLHRPTAAQLLEHPFVKYAAPLERSMLGLEPSDPPSGIINGAKALGIGQGRNFSNLDSDRLAIHSSRHSKTNNHTSEIHIPRNISCPVSPIESPLLPEDRISFFEGSNLAFDLLDLLGASAEVLGKGTFGTTYKADLENATTVVVKRMKVVSVGKKKFEQQIEIVGSIRHENIASLRAYYYSKYEKLVVYDYYEQGSASSLLHAKRGEGRIPFDWETRLKIAIGAARGIAHIHRQNGGKLVHGNIKASNIFLNSQGYGCVCDVGLPTLMGPTPPPAARTGGYRAPEVKDTRKSSPASDVYSFGVLLLELLTGKSPIHTIGGKEVVHLVRWVNCVVREDWTAEVFDVELLRYPNIEDEMVEMLQIGMSCVARMPEQRPNMPDLVKRVEEIRQVNTGTRPSSGISTPILNTPTPPSEIAGPSSLPQ